MNEGDQLNSVRLEAIGDNQRGSRDNDFSRVVDPARSAYFWMPGKILSRFFNLCEHSARGGWFFFVDLGVNFV